MPARTPNKAAKRTPKKKVPSVFTHGRSEVWERPAVVRAAMKELVRLGVRLRALRVEAGLSQLLAAELVGLHPTQMWRIEAGVSNVKFLTLVAFARAYGVSLHELFEEKPKPPKKSAREAVPKRAQARRG